MKKQFLALLCVASLFTGVFLSSNSVQADEFPLFGGAVFASSNAFSGVDFKTFFFILGLAVFLLRLGRRERKRNKIEISYVDYMPTEENNWLNNLPEDVQRHMLEKIRREEQMLNASERSKASSSEATKEESSDAIKEPWNEESQEPRGGISLIKSRDRR